MAANMFIVNVWVMTLCGSLVGEYQCLGVTFCVPSEGRTFRLSDRSSVCETRHIINWSAKAEWYHTSYVSFQLCRVLWRVIMECKEIVWYGMSWMKTLSQHLGDWWCSAILHLCCHSYWVFRDRLRNWLWVLVWLLRPGYSLTGYNPGMLTGLRTGHNTLRRDLYIMRLIKSPLHRRC